MARVFGAQRDRTRMWIAFPIVVTLALLAMGAALRLDEDKVHDIGTVMLLGGLALAPVTLALMIFTRYRVVVGDDGIQIKGPRSLVLGRPKKLRCGQYEDAIKARIGTPYVAGRVNVPIKRVWVAVEGEGGAQVVFHAGRSMLARNLGWPTGHPPEAEHVFYGDVVALRDAIGEAIR